MPSSLLKPSDQDQFADLANGLQLCYRTYGESKNPAIVLIAGLGLHLMSWPVELIEGLVNNQLYVITLDNRDIGRSTSLPQKSPARWRLLFGFIPAGHYQIKDMADDVAHLLTYLGVKQAHVIGMSMGGMIAQNFASQYPTRTLSLTSIFSSTGNPNVGKAAGSTILRMLLKRPAQTVEAAQDQYVRIMRHIGNPKAPGIEAVWRDYALQAWRRSEPLQAQQGYKRQVAAILGSGDRSARLYQIDTPTLVIHGDKDRAVHPSGGVATARSIAGAQMHTIHGMRHQIDAQVTPYLLEMIIPHIRQAVFVSAA